MLAQVNARVMLGLDSIAVPTLVLVGAEDKPYLGAAEYMARKIPARFRWWCPGRAMRPIWISLRPSMPRS